MLLLHTSLRWCILVLYLLLLPLLCTSAQPNLHIYWNLSGIREWRASCNGWLLSSRDSSLFIGSGRIATPSSSPSSFPKKKKQSLTYDLTPESCLCPFLAIWVSFSFSCVWPSRWGQRSIAHPYLLADNRHYTFYFWRKIIQAHWASKYLMIPLCVYGWFSMGSILGLTMLSCSLIYSFHQSLSRLLVFLCAHDFWPWKKLLADFCRQGGPGGGSGRCRSSWPARRPSSLRRWWSSDTTPCPSSSFSWTPTSTARFRGRWLPPSFSPRMSSPCRCSSSGPSSGPTSRESRDSSGSIWRMLTSSAGDCDFSSAGSDDVREGKSGEEPAAAS